MNVLVTGSNGFLGRHLVTALERAGHMVLPFDVDSDIEALNRKLDQADCVVHLAGVNRPKRVEEFYEGNAGFTRTIVEIILKKNRVLPVIFASSIQVERENDYGKSKRMAEVILFSSGLPVYVFRLHNVYGEGCRPEYNSVIATFCHHIALDKEIRIDDENAVIPFEYVDDVCSRFLDAVEGRLKPSSNPIVWDKPDYCSIGRLASLLHDYKEATKKDPHMPTMASSFEWKLFKTFLSYFPNEGSAFRYAKDERGSFQELFKSKKYGQISINTIAPGYTKGGHYHTRKDEWFLTVEGYTRIEQYSPETGERFVDESNEENRKPVYIRTGFIHGITNTGDKPSKTFMWINEIYNPEDPDTWRKEEKK